MQEWTRDGGCTLQRRISGAVRESEAECTCARNGRDIEKDKGSTHRAEAEHIHA